MFKCEKNTTIQTNEKSDFCIDEAGGVTAPFTMNETAKNKHFAQYAKKNRNNSILNASELDFIYTMFKANDTQ